MKQKSKTSICHKTACVISIDYRLKEPILQILYGGKTVFMHSTITPPKVNRFGWDLEQCEPNVGGWPWQILGAIRAVATFWKRKKCSQNFQVLRLQAIITPQWLQMTNTHGQIVPLVSIFAVRIHSTSFPWDIRCVPEWYLPIFLAVVDGHRGRLAESWRKSKQTNVCMAAVRRCVSK